jgi:hypothetical protein
MWLITLLPHYLYFQRMKSPAFATHPNDEKHDVIQALNAARTSPLVSLGSVDEAMTYLKKRYLVE